MNTLANPGDPVVAVHAARSGAESAVKALGHGSFRGALWSLLPRSALFMLPPLGIVAAAGPITLTLVAALESAGVAGGVSALRAALAGLGMHHDQAIQYEADVAADRLPVIVHGSQEDVAGARRILAAANAAQRLAIHQAA